ncbi:pleckstrin homology domain-containing family M member 2 isoform X2 [Ambystoma mexicanum]|uniref:pleckstrin homology domain-containing family M member 2 isoform X2 n=1 Tax=Ambystoma mexicanum TaxID=8296 RepID=UPI0037E975A7
MEPRQVKDRILENISLSVKKLQSYFAACEDETPAIRNHDKVLQRLCEHIDHALLYGLQDISSGYWVLVVHFTRKEAIKQIEVLQNVATNLGRSRAWLYLALNENSLESYLRLFQENQSLLQKYYFKNALVCSDDHLTLFLTLVAGLEFIRFELEQDVPYLDVAPYMPEYYKPQYLLDFEDRLPSSMHGSDSLSLNSFNSITSTNLEWDDSAIAPSSEEGELTETVTYEENVAPESCTVVAAVKSPSQRYNPFNGDRSDELTSSESTPAHTASLGKAEDTADGTDQSESCMELEVIRIGKKKKGCKKRKARLEYSVSHSPLTSVDTESSGKSHSDMDSGLPSTTGSQEGAAFNGDPGELNTMSLCIPQMKDTSMESVGQPLSEVMDCLNGQLDTRGWDAHSESRDQSFRTHSPGETPGDNADCNFSEGIPASRDFYRFTPESPNAPAAGGCYDDIAGNGQPSDVSGSSEAVVQAEEGETVGSIENSSRQSNHALENGLTEEVHELEGGAQSPGVSSAEDSGVEEGQGSPSEMTHSCEFRVDNNHLLLLMIHVFQENEEQLYKMFRMSSGHMEGNLQLVYVLLTDCYIYLLRKGATEKPYMVEEAISYNELDYVSVGLDQQTVMLVCTNRRRQFLVDTSDVTLTECFITALRSAMVKGCREPPYPGILTDATMEKLALAKFIAQESKCEAADVTVHFYGLVHWEDPLDETLGPASHYSSTDHPITKEGILHYKASTSYLGKEHWKTCFVVLSNGVLYQYPERTDVTPLLSVNVGGEQCGGCRRSNTTERPHSFQVILTDRPSLELSAGNEEEMADWMLYLCQAVSKGVIPPGVAPIPCIPCCLVVTDDKVFTCHEDCQTFFFRSLGKSELADVASVSTEPGKEYCIMDFSQDQKQFLPPWVLYFSCTAELDRFLLALGMVWQSLYQVTLPHKLIQEPSVKKKCEDALSLIHSAWQRSDSLHRGRSSRDPWC